MAKAFIHDLPGLNSIQFGRLHLKPSSIYETITHCTRMVLHEADDPRLPLGRGGSATLVRYRGRSYIITTRHGLGIERGVVPSANIVDTVRISTGIGQLGNIPIRRCVFEETNTGEEYHDILVFEAVETWETKAADSPYFIDLRPFSREARPASFLIGYPCIPEVMSEYIDSYEAGTVGTIHLTRSIVDCKFDPNYTTAVEYMRRYTHDKADIMLDGFSGGAILSLVGGGVDWEIILDGIVLRAGPGNIYIIDADYLVRMVSA